MTVPTDDALFGELTAVLSRFPAAQRPGWVDPDAVDGPVRQLRLLPPLVFAGECDQLRDRLAAVSRGEAFLLQGGDCAESFDGVTANNVRN